MRYENKRMNKTLLTLVVGIGIGLLVAPDKGSRTWKRLKDGFSDLKDDAEEELDEMLHSGKKILKHGKKKLADEIN
jgi:gas vesicle protein